MADQKRNLQRREFLKRSAVATGGLVIASGHAMSFPMSAFPAVPRYLDAFRLYRRSEVVEIPNFVVGQAGVELLSLRQQAVGDQIVSPRAKRATDSNRVAPSQ